MDEASITKYITDTFAGVDVVVASGDSFFFYDPDRTAPPDQRFPFATLVTSDRDDPFSNLNRPSVFRLNIGVGKQTYGSLFGTQPSGAGTEGAYDFTALDRIMPHPVYGKMYWVCVLNPSEATFQAVRPLLAEAYDAAVSKYSKRAARG
jgi:hypothetical protein